MIPSASRPFRAPLPSPIGPNQDMQTRKIATSVLKGGGYLALPDGDGPHPGVVVIHEAYGLNDHIKDITRRFADAGYAALAVDLFTGRNRAVCMSRYMAGMLIGSVNRYGIDDLKSGLTFLAKLTDVDAQRMGAIGFCMGGGFAIAWACTDSRLKAIAPFYAATPRPLDVVRRLCPVVGSYPEQDFTARAGRRWMRPPLATTSPTTSRPIPARILLFSMTPQPHKASSQPRTPGPGCWTSCEES